MAGSLFRFRRRISKQVILVLLAGNPLHAAQQIVGVRNHKATRAAGECIKHLLIRSPGLNQRRQNMPRLVIEILQRRIVHAGKRSQATAAAASRTRAAADTPTTNGSSAAAAAATTTATSRPTTTAAAATRSASG